MKLAILSGGAAQGLVAALARQFEAETGCGIAGTFGAVGAMRDKLLAGEPADLLILTARPDRGADAVGPRAARLRRRHRRRAHGSGGEGRRSAALHRRCGGPALGTARGRRHLLPRSRSWRRPASISPRCSTRSALPPRWPRGCARSPTAPPPCRRWPAPRTLAPSAARRSPRSSTRRAWRSWARCPSSSSSPPSTRPASAPAPPCPIRRGTSLPSSAAPPPARPRAGWLRAGRVKR